MRRIQFKSHGPREVDVPDVRLGFVDGEVKTVSDEHAAILLTNTNFIDADLGRNPNFVKDENGAHTWAAAPAIAAPAQHDDEDEA